MSTTPTPTPLSRGILPASAPSSQTTRDYLLWMRGLADEEYLGRKGSYFRIQTRHYRIDTSGVAVPISQMTYYHVRMGLE